ncbi:MAG: site-2 protease family protein [Gammaproteobacteria bacterium]|nr:MAG: site-2 protease family protein [Gammaproteobacteria bacterium]
MSELTLPQLIAVAALPILFAITVHEVAHGWVAKQLGDPTAERMGRLTLNPIKHIDPVGTVLVPVLLLLTAGVAIGWAKPVPVTWENLRRPKRDMALVALAGPASNLIMAILWGVAIKLAINLPPSAIWLAQPLAHMAQWGILINILLMVFNLLPIPPLDGGRVAVGLLPRSLGWQLGRLEPYGFFIIIGLMMTGVLWFMINPMRLAVQRFVAWLVGL